MFWINFALCVWNILQTLHVERLRKISSYVFKAWGEERLITFSNFLFVFHKQHPHHSSLKEEVSDVVRQKKKYLKKPKIECVVTPQQPSAEPLPAINKSDIKQYDFHSSDEDEFPQVISVTKSQRTEGRNFSCLEFGQSSLKWRITLLDSECIWKMLA